MKVTRKEDISLYLYLKDTIVGPEYYEISEGLPIINVGTNTWEIGHVSNKCPFERDECSGRGRGLLYFNVANGCCTFGTEQDNMVIVYNGPTQASGYQVNYLKGQLITSQDLSNYQADYYWHYVSVIDAWPYADVPPLPIISLELQESSSDGLQLGYGDIRTGFWNVQIFASNKGERDDLMDILYDGIYNKRCSIYEFENGLPLIRNGLFNTSFSVTLHEYYKSLHFESVRKSLSGLPQWGFYSQEEINRYRAEITFETLAYKS